jgi:hypothetical protein
MPAQPAFQHAKAPIVFAGIPRVGIPMVAFLNALGIIHEMAELTSHGP